MQEQQGTCCGAPGRRGVNESVAPLLRDLTVRAMAAVSESLRLLVEPYRGTIPAVHGLVE